MKLVRTWPTGRLLFFLTIGAVGAIAAVTAAVALAGGGGSVPRPQPLAQALHGALTADRPSSVSARIRFTNGLVPGSSLSEGRFGSALLTGASGRLWLMGDGRGRLELQSDAGDTQLVWNHDEITVYDASSDTVYRAKLPQGHDAADAEGSKRDHAPPSIAEIEQALSKLAVHADLSGATPTDVAGEPAYSVRIAPKDHSSLLGEAELAWDAVRGVPLRVGIYARGAAKPVLELAVTDIQFGGVSDGDVSISPPADATVVDLAPPSGGGSSGSHAKPIEGLAAVQAAAGFPVSFPDTVAGRARTAVRLVGNGDSQTAVGVYGENLGAIVVVERKAGDRSPSPLSSLPTVTAGGHAAHELATPLATILEWQAGGVSTILAGSVTPAIAESAAADVG